MHEAVKNLKLCWVSGLLALLLMGCSENGVDPDDESEGGVIGTGLILQGTVTDVRLFASNSLQIKSLSGEISNAIIDDTGRYKAPSVKGAPPYILRADLGNSEYRYGIAFDTERTNVNSYTDIILRNWFEGNNGIIDFEFEQQSISTVLPNRAQYRENANKFFEIVGPVLETYGVVGEQLLTGDYDSSTTGDGIDNYLRNNTMLVNDNKISFVITDPDTNIQSTTRSGYSLYELTEEPDTEAPEAPTSVRALPSDIEEVVIAWSPSLDNRGVAYYEVFRDGALIATTPYPVLFDKGLESGREYIYTITAVDSSNNTSVLSVQVSSRTLAEPDGIAPPAPVRLSVEPMIGRMELEWAQTDIADVVRFEVFRGRNNDPLEFLTSVTSTFITDVTVSSGVEYCYQIIALDASDNPSEGSDEVCVMASGLEVVNSENLPVPEVPLFAGLNIPDIESMECTNEWTEYEISRAMQVDAGCYVVSDSITVSNGGSLSLGSGVVLKFGSGTGIVVNTGGSFSADGTKAEPAVLTAQDPTPGYWHGIRFNQSNSSRNRLVNTVVEYAGGGGTAAAVRLFADVDQISRIDISGSVIRSCVGAGLRSDIPWNNINRIDGSVITQCDLPMDLHITGLGGVTQRNNFTGNLRDVIDLRSATINSDMLLKDLGIPYVTSRIYVVEGNLKLLDGVELQFESNGDFVVSGSLTVEGRIDNRVKITGTIKERGHWGVISINGKAAFNYVDIEFGGYGNDRPVDSASLLVGTGSASLSNVSINNSANFAIHMYHRSGRITSINDLALSGNEKTIRIGLSQLHQLGDQLGLTANDNPTIELTTANLSDIDVDIFDLGVPYLLTTSVQWDLGSFRVRPGVELYMGDGVSVDILNGASFTSVGTIENPISMTHASGLSGAWAGISIGSNSNLNRIEHTKIAFSGGSIDGISAAVRLECNPQAMVFLANSTIEDSAGWGVTSSSSVGCGLTLGENVQFNRNRSGDIAVD